MAKASIITIIIVIVAIAIGWYLISPAFTTSEIDEESPLIIRDSLTSMTDHEKAEFDSAVEAMADQTNEMMDSTPMSSSTAQLLSQGTFKPRAHEVGGEALLIEDANGNKVLRFENFDTINGPNLHIYLSSSLGAGDSIDLGKIKATKGNVNYAIPDNIDTDKYNKVLIWCVPFNVLFSYADLQ